MVGDILPLLSLEKRNRPVQANGAPWEYPKVVACRACSGRTIATGAVGAPTLFLSLTTLSPVLSERGSGELQKQPCSMGRLERA